MLFCICANTRVRRHAAFSSELVCIWILAEGTFGQAGDAGTPGSSACPCLSDTSKGLATIRAAISKKGYGDENYGLSGCKAYDMSQEYPLGCTSDKLMACEIDCKSNQHPYCRSSWCYVDPLRCSMNETSCIAAGGTLGDSRADVSCSEREFTRSTFFANLKVPLYYSYATCGYVDDWGAHQMLGAMGNSFLHVATHVNGLYPLSQSQGKVTPLMPELQGIRGPWVEVFYEMVKSSVIPFPNMLVNISWSTQESRSVIKEVYNSGSSYTACALDVALGKYDVCVADVWHTSQRERMTAFLPPIALVDFLLFVPLKKDAGVSFQDMFSKPFLPFAWAAWGLIAAFLALSALAIYATDSFDDNSDLPFPADGYRLPNIAKSLYLAVIGFVAQNSEQRALTLPGKLVKLSFSFFILVTLCSYTANLATILVADAEKMQINGVEDLISQRSKFCLVFPGLLGPSIYGKYPDLEEHAIELPDTSAAIDGGYGVFNKLRNGECPAAIVTSDLWFGVQSGAAAEYDCEQGNAGCKYNDDGTVDRKRDCARIRQVKGSLGSMPFAWPVSKRWEAPLRKAMMVYMDSGQHAAKFQMATPASACGVKNEEQHAETLQMQASSMYGTCIVSGSLMVLALMLGCLEQARQQSLHEMLGYREPEATPDQAAMPNPQRPRKRSSFVGGRHRSSKMSL